MTLATIAGGILAACVFSLFAALVFGRIAQRLRSHRQRMEAVEFGAASERHPVQDHGGVTYFVSHGDRINL